MLNKLISGWAYNCDKNAFCSNFGQKRGVGVHSGVGLLSSEYGKYTVKSVYSPNYGMTKNIISGQRIQVGTSYKYRSEMHNVVMI